MSKVSLGFEGGVPEGKGAIVDVLDSIEEGDCVRVGIILPSGKLLDATWELIERKWKRRGEYKTKDYGNLTDRFSSSSKVREA